MWGVDDDIRDLIKDLIAFTKEEKAPYNPILEKWEKLKEEIEEMIFKEEEIMVPMTLDVFSMKDWEKIAADSFEIGFSYIPDPLPWKPSAEDLEKELEREPLRLAKIEEVKEATAGIAAGLNVATKETKVDSKVYEWENTKGEGIVVLPTGMLQLEQLIAMFECLPVDLTFVDDQDIVRFYSEGKERIFPRTKSVIGRAVVNCHPPKSMHIVEQILVDFRSGTRDHADFWIDLGPRKIYIRYFALRNDTTYLGCLEVSQDVTEIQKLEGQNRLLEGFTKD